MKYRLPSAVTVLCAVSIATVVRGDVVLLTNLAEPLRSATPIADPEYWAAQSFLPDDDYWLSSIDAIVGNGLETPSIIAELRASDDADQIDFTPLGLLTTLTPPDMSDDLAERRFLPDLNVMLEADRHYWFVVGVTGGGSFEWGYANTNDFVGPGVLSGFADSADAGGTWTYHEMLFPYLVGIHVEPVVHNFFEADFDEDGDVDGTDFLIWQSNFGTPDGATHGQGDADIDGDVDGADFLTWQAQFGSGVEQRPSGSTPEPATAQAAAILLAVALATRRLAGRGSSDPAIRHS